MQRFLVGIVIVLGVAGIVVVSTLLIGFFYALSVSPDPYQEGFPQIPLFGW